MKIVVENTKIVGWNCVTAVALVLTVHNYLNYGVLYKFNSDMMI